MNITKKLTSWSYVVILGSLGGLGLGMACDRILWEWSYDYVFPATYCRNGGLRLGFLLGTIVAAATTIGEEPMPHFRWTTISGMTAMLMTTFIAVSVATLAWSWVKYGGERQQDGFAPLSRMAFCSELARSAVYGAWIAALGWTVAVWQHRKSIVAEVNCVSIETGGEPS